VRTDWYETQQRMDSERRAVSLSVVQEAQSIYSTVMGWLHERLREAVGEEPITDAALQAKLITANHAFNLICSAWEDVLSGRYEAATDHWRSVIEAPKFLLALRLNPQLASEMFKGRVSIHKAIQTIEQGLAQELRLPDKKLTAKWVANFRRETKNVQGFSHVNVALSSAGYQRTTTDKGLLFLLIPGGAVDVIAARDGVLYLTDAATHLAMGVALAFSDKLTTGDDEFLEKCKASIYSLATRWGIPVPSEGG
jgi:hypothetical protein